MNYKSYVGAPLVGALKRAGLLVIAITFILRVNTLCAEEAVRVGVTYSPQQSVYLNQEWKKTYIEILDAGFRVIRLGAYWSEIEAEPGVYDFSELDWQIAEAAKRNIPILLTVGMKAPRWPEYFIPEWVLKKTDLRFGGDVSEDAYLREKTLEFLRIAVSRYSSKAIIHWWQVENEPLNRAGPRQWWIKKDFLAEEVKLVKRLDERNRPIVINAATYPNKTLRFLVNLTSPNHPIPEAIELCDIFAINVYPIVGHKFMWMKMRLWTHPPERVEHLSEIVNSARAQNKDVWVTELQTEPWEPGELVHMGPEKSITAWPSVFQSDFEELRSIGIKTILLWGAEYWIYRRDTYDDKSWWEAGMDIVNGHRGAGPEARGKKM